VKKSGLGFAELSKKYVIIYLMMVLAIIMAFVNRNFFTANNAISIMRSISVQGIMACGMTMVMISGEIDLSFASTAAFGGLIVSMFSDRLSKAGVMSVDASAYFGILIALFMAISVGLANAYLIYKWKMPTMIVTLAMQYVVYGTAGWLSNGWAYYTLPSWWTLFGTKRVFHNQIPLCVFILIAVWLIYYVIMNHTKLGRKVYAVGGNAEAARLSGINVYRIKQIVMVSNQVCALIAGIVLSSQIMSASASLASSLPLTVIAAVVIGGTGVGGGKGSIVGTAFGMLFLGMILNSMTIANLPEFPQYIVRGLLIIFAIMLNVLQGRPRKRRTLMTATAPLIHRS